MKWKGGCQGNYQCRQKRALRRLHSRRKHSGAHTRLGAGALGLASARIHRGLTANGAMELEECYDDSTSRGLRQPTVTLEVPRGIGVVHRALVAGVTMPDPRPCLMYETSELAQLYLLYLKWSGRKISLGR